MRPYVDEDYYEENWMTGTIPEDALEKYLSRASMEIDNMTSGRLRKGLPTEYYQRDRIKSAVCEVADLMYSYNMTDRLAMQALAEMKTKELSEKGIKSVSDGTESIAYTSGSDLVAQAKALFPELAATKEERHKAIRHIIWKYLAGIPDVDGTNLLYAG